MKKLVLPVLAMLLGFTLQAQTVIYQEDFEGMTPSVTTGGAPGWAVNDTLYNNGLKSYSAPNYFAGDSSVMITDAFSTLGSLVVTLEFSHICKVEFLDGGEIYVSNDNGVNWTQLTEVHYRGVSGFSAATGNKFTSTSYSTWLPGNPTLPNNTWWEDEIFDISAIAANSANVKIKFVVRDFNNGTQFDNWGWAVDDIKVTVPPQQEASIEGIILPLSLPSGCGLEDEVIQVRIANNGGNNISGNLTATFQRDGALPVSEQVSTLIIPGDTLTYTFNSTIDLFSTQDTTYNIMAWVTLTGDPDATNDTTNALFDSKVALPDPVINDTIIPYGTSVTLTATHNDSVFWFSDPLGTNMILMGSSFTTPVLYDSAVYYVQGGMGGSGTGVMPELLYYKFDTPGTSVMNEALQPVGNSPANITGTSLAIGGTGMMGTALVGTGGSSSSNVINTGWSTNLQGSFTLSFWTSDIAPSSTLYYIFGDAGASSFRCFTNGAAGASNWMVRGGGLPDLTITGAATMTPNYIHVVYDAAAGQYRGYIDGLLVSTVSAPTSNTISGSGFQIGGYSSNTGLNGLMDEFRIYNRALTQAEINQSLLPVSATCPSRVVPVTVALSGMPQQDAGVIAVAPSGSINSGTPYPIEVTIQNFGLDTLKKAIINYSINGVLQTPYNWTGSLLKNGTDGPITLGTHSFSSGVSQIVAWTTSPNDSLDWANHNDTTKSTVYSCLSGTITVGGPSADFNDFDELNTVVSLVGMCGPTIVEVNPGTYNGPILLTGAMGMSSTDTLVIRSATQNANDVIIEYAASGTADNFVLKLDGASYVTVENITFKAIGASYGRVVEFANGSSYNVLRGNVFESVVGSTSSNWAGIYSTSNAPSNYNLIENNTIIGGYYGIYWYGSSANRKTGNTIKNNIIDGYYYYGIYSYYSDSTSIIGNTLTNATNSSTLYPIYYRYNQGYGLVDKNRVIGTNTGTFYGINVGYNSLGSTPGVVQVSNNYIYQSVGTGTAYGLYLYYCNHTTDVFNNTVEMTGGSTTAGRALYHTNGSGMVNLQNNIFHNSNGGYAYYINTIAQIGTSDYNNIYSNGSSVAYWSGAKATLGALQTSSGKDVNSLSVNTNFLISGQPYVMDSNLDSAATPLATVPDDIDGNPRNLTHPDIGAAEFVISPNDAGVLALISPEAPCPGDTADVVVRLFNFGTSPLTSCGIHWTFNGVPQDSVAFSGNIASTSYQDVLIGEQVFQSGFTYDIQAYTTFPNGVVDMNNGNDTMFAGGIQTSFPSGIYTIGGVGADYPTIDTVVQILNASGVCGPVTFNINDGNYNTSILLENIKGTSAVNTITFQSTSQDSSLVVIEYAASSATDNYVVKLNGTSHVTFRQLTLKAAGTSYGRVVELAGGSHYNTFTGCSMETSTTSTSSNFAGVYATGVSNNYNAFIDNVIMGGYYGIYFYGTSSTARGNNLVMENNKFLSIYYYGINVAYYDSVVFNGNMVTSAANTGSAYGARIYYCDFIEVVGNDIQIAGTSTHYGLYLYYNDGSTTQRNLVANNFVSLAGTGTGTWYGVYLYYNEYTDFYHNTIHNALAGGSTNRTMYQSGGTSINMVNNIFTNTGNGYAYYINTTGAIQNSNYNNYYTTGSSFAYWSGAKADLSALQSANGQDANSTSTDPLYVSNTDLHVLNAMLNGAGTPLASVPVDIDGEPRSATHPDIGADEFVTYGLIAGLVDYQTSFGGCGFDSTLVSVNLVNMGVDTLDATSNLILSFQVNQNTPVHENFTGILPAGDTALFTFSTYAQFPLSFPVDSVFNLTTWITLANGIAVNDTLYTTVWNGYQPPAPVVSDTTIPYGTSVTLHVVSTDSIIWYDSPTAQNSLAGGYTYTTPNLLVPTTYWVEGVGSGASGGAFIFTEVAHYKYTTGAPVGGWPSYLLADDYIEITGAPGSDLGGFTLEQWDASSLVSSHTFPSGTVMSPNGTAIIAVGQLSSSSPVPSSFYYHGNGSYTGSFSSTTAAGRILKDPSGQIMDAHGYNGYNFPSSANVPASDWSNPLSGGGSTSGQRLIGPDDNTGANWVVSSSTYPQDPNTLNAGVTIPSGAGCPSARVPLTVYLSGMPAYDLGISTIMMAEGCVSSEPLTIEIYNQGTDTLFTGGQAGYRIDNNPWITPESINVPIAPGDTILYTFNTIPGINPATDTLFTVTAWVSVSGDPYQLNDTLVKDSLDAFYTPPSPVVSNVTIPYATFTTLTAQSQDSVYWWAQPTDTVELAIGSSFQTPILFGQTTYWVSAKSGSGGTLPGPNYVPGPNIAPQAVASASNCSTGPCSAFNDLNLGVCGTQLVWVSTSNPPSTTPHDNYIDFEWPSDVTIDGLTIHHASATTRFLTGAALYKWDNNNWVHFYTFSNLPIQCENTFPFPSVTTTKLRLTSFEMNGPSQTSNPNFREIEVHAGMPAGCESPRVPLVVNVGNPPPIDAGVFTVENPVGSVPSGTNQNIDVTVRNYGTDTLTSFTLTYELDGVVQGSYNWTGTIAPADTSLPITVYTDNFAGGVYNMRVWVSNANGTAQGVNSNDTITHTFAACLNGTYTIGGATSDFASFGDAMSAIDLAGICGHVTFMVQPGMYNEQLLFNANANINSNNTVTFQGATGDSTQVTLQYAAAGTGDNYVVKLNDAHYITFKHMTIKANGGSYGYAVTLSGSSSYNEFSGNVIQTSVATSSSFSGIYVTGSLANNNLIQGNRIIGGYYGIYWYAPSSSNRAHNNSFVNNEIVDFYYYGANIAYVDSLIFNGNTIQNGSSSGSVYGARLYYGDQIEVVGNKIEVAGTSTHYGMYLYQNTASGSNRNLVANNFVSMNGTGTSTWYGIYFGYQTNTDFYHNSVHHTGGSLTAGGCLYVTSGGSNNVVNNIFSNVGGGYAYYISTTGAIATSDYNNFHVTASNLAYWGGAVSTLAGLRTTSGKEMNSLDVNPQFYSSTNLHILSNLLDGAGTPLTAVPNDIDGELRDLLTPDIGADEFTPAQKDLGATALVSPVPYGCFGANETVIVQIQNYGLDTLDFTLSPATVTASVSGINPVTFPVVTVNTGTLNPGATLDVVITTNYDMSVNGVYTFNASATVSGDGNVINDAMPPLSMNVTATVTTFPYFEDFEGSTTGSPGSLNNGWVADPASSGAYSWYVNSGTTSSSSTGPSGDHTTGTGKYVYTESSSGSTGSEAFLTSPCLDLSGFTTPVVKFWFHMYGSTMGELYTQALDANGNWVNVDTISGQQHSSEADPWTQRTVDLTGYTNHITRIRFKAVRGTNYYCDIAIDDIYINEPVQVDAGVKDILQPATSFSSVGASQQVEALVQNYGFTSQTEIPVAYRYNGGVVHRDTVYGNFGMDTTKAITFVTPFTVLSGNKQLEVWTELPGDLTANNDTLSIMFMGLDVNVVPFCDDFEGADAWASGGEFDQWERGTPIAAVINTAHSGTNVWAVNLSGQYLDDSDDFLYTPYFDFSSLSATDTASIEFWHWMDVQSNSDYGQVQYSLNGGQSWSGLGFYMDPYGTNWYNMTSGGAHFFSSTNTGWQKSSYKLLPSTFNQPNLVQFRFRFFSNASVSNYDGWAIDDFCLTLPMQPNDVGISAIQYPVNDTATGSDVNVQVTIKNYGANPQTMFPVELLVDGVVITTETWSGSLPSQGTVNYTFVLPYTVPAAPYNLCARTNLTGDGIPTNNQLCKSMGVLPAYDDVGINMIVSPMPDSAGNICLYNAQLQPWYQYDVVVRLENYGQNPQTSIPVNYSFYNGGTVYTDTWTGTLAPNATVDFTLSNLFKPNNGIQQLCAETDLTGDAVAANDKKCQTYTGVLCTGVDETLGGSFALFQNVPNPTTGTTSISYVVPQGGEVNFGIVNMVGQILHREQSSVLAGQHQIDLDVTNFAAGVYYYYVEFNGQRLTKKLVVKH